MVRNMSLITTLFAFMLLAQVANVHADDQPAQPTEPSKASTAATQNRFDPKLSPAVHVNSTGLENSYGSRKSSSAANRLRSVRETPLLQLTSPKVKPKKEAAPKKTTENPSSRRLKKADTPAEAPKTITKQPAKVAAIPKRADAASRLTSVMTRRGQAEPTLALPPAKVPAPQFSAVEASPTPTSSRKASPVATIPAGQADFVAELATPVLATPELATPGNDAPALANPPAIVTTPIEQPVRQPVRTAALPKTPVRPEPMTLSAGTTESPVQAPARSADTANRVTNEAPMRGNFNELSMPTPETSAQRRPQPTRRPQLRKSATAQTANPMAAETPRANPKRPTSKTDVKNDTTPEDMLLSNRSPILVVRTHGQTKIRVGRPATYYVTAANKGDMAAQDVVVNVNVPNWAELTRNESSAGAVRIEPDLHGDNVLHWTIRDLEPGASQRLRIDLVPRTSRPLELGVTWNLKSVSAMAQIEVEEPKLRLSVVGPGDIRYGDTKLYSITVSNPGTGDAENVILQLLPMNGAGGTAGERELGSLKAGTQRTVEVELTARQAGDLAIRAQAIADGGLRADGEQPVRVRRPNLVVQAVGPKKRYAGTPARYTLKITNNGDATARDVVASAGLPMGAQFVKSSKNGAYDKNRNLVQWSVGTLRPGAQQIVEVIAVLNGSGESRMDARASAKIDQLSATDSVATKVEALADLRLTVVDPVGPVPLGTEVTYEVIIENRGTKAANDINVVGYFSEGIEPVSVKGWQGKVGVGEVALESIPQVSPGQRLVIKVIAEASRSGNHVFRAELDSNDPSTKTKLAVEEWTVFHADSEPLLDTPIQQADQDAVEPAPVIR